MTSSNFTFICTYLLAENIISGCAPWALHSHPLRGNWKFLEISKVRTKLTLSANIGLYDRRKHFCVTAKS